MSDKQRNYSLNDENDENDASAHSNMVEIDVNPPSTKSSIYATSQQHIMDTQGTNAKSNIVNDQLSQQLLMREN